MYFSRWIEAIGGLAYFLALPLSPMGQFYGVGMRTCFPALVAFSILSNLLHSFLLCFILQEKRFSREALAEIPSCNLAETMHAKWQKSSGTVVDLYDATVDDYIRAFLQITAYRDYRLGGNVGQGPSQEELQLHVAQRLATRRRDPTHLQRAVEKLPVAEEICTRNPHYEGAEVFGS